MLLESAAPSAVAPPGSRRPRRIGCSPPSGTAPGAGAKGMPADADSTAWAVRVLLAVDRPVPERTADFLARHLRSTGVGTYSDPATGMWTQPMPEVTAVALQVIESAGWLRADELDEHWAALGEGPVWTSHRWPGSAHPTALVMHARHRAGRRAGDVEDPLTSDGSIRLGATTGGIRPARDGPGGDQHVRAG